MKSRQLTNIGASIRNRLLNVAKETHVDFNRILLLYFQERFLYRLSLSPYKKSFVLKGGVLLYGAHQMKARPTRDIDFLATNFDNQTDDFSRALEEIISIQVNDGVAFDPASISVETIGQPTNNAGVRCKITAHLDTARLALQLDLGLGDVVFPSPLEFEYPALLKSESIKIAAYSWDSVVAEKFEACVKLSDLNSRMKDFFDLHFLLAHHHFSGKILQESLRATFQNRDTDIGEAAHIFSEDFFNEPNKQKQWSAFLRTNRLLAPLTFPEVVLAIKDFLFPATHALIYNTTFNKKWNAQKHLWTD